MRKPLPFWLAIAVCAAALVASSLLLVDYVRPAPVFCEGGGCGIVRRSAFAYPFGIPTPLIGIGGFLAIGLTQLLSGRRARIAQISLAVFGGVAGAGFLVVQEVLLKTLCPYCFVVDISAIVVAGLSVARARQGWDPPESRRQVFGAALALCTAVGAPVAFGMSKKAIDADVPAVIAAEMRKTPRRQVTVVDFIDFECPYCRMTHAALAPLLAERKDKVRVVRRHVPLRMHPHAMDAARAALCGEKLGKADEMVDALFLADLSALTPDGYAAIAEKNGLDGARFRECFTSAETEARIKADGEFWRATQGHGLPTLFIDGTKLEGAQEPEILKSTLDSAIRAL